MGTSSAWHDLRIAPKQEFEHGWIVALVTCSSPFEMVSTGNRGFLTKRLLNTAGTQRGHTEIRQALATHKASGSNVLAFQADSDYSGLTSQQ